jgi:hypothetical protein
LGILCAEGIEEITARGFATGDDADDFKAFHGMIGFGVGFAHVAAADDEDSDRSRHNWIVVEEDTPK